MEDREGNKAQKGWTWVEEIDRYRERVEAISQQFYRSGGQNPISEFVFDSPFPPLFLLSPHPSDALFMEKDSFCCLHGSPPVKHSQTCIGFLPNMYH